mmetsp:Transcript_15090/g.23429  ORF Transcript_15090/g.23429 Transcript_15090/m.23429 type:complete len:294 (-) Transcript_15090:27-908(-)
MIGTHLPIQKRVDIITLPKQNLALLTQSIELPTNESIVVRVYGGGNERSPPVHTSTKLLQMIDSNGRKVGEPLIRIDEFTDNLFRDHFFQNGPLPYDAGSSLGHQLRLPTLGLFIVALGSLGFCCSFFRSFALHLRSNCRIILWEGRRQTVICNLRLQLIRCGLNGHTGTMKAERKEHVLASMPLKLCTENGLRQTESVPNVQYSVHVGVRECYQKGFFCRVGVGFVGFGLLPFLLYGDLVGAQGVAFGCALAGNVEVRHGLSRCCLGTHFLIFCCCCFRCCCLQLDFLNYKK